MSEIKTNKISPRKGTTQTIGDSGDTISIPCGVTTTNAGTITTAGITGGTINNSGGTLPSIRGVIEWDTTAKTTAFTAESNKGYFCNTTSAAFTVTLPASPTAGDVIGLKDYANTFDTNNLTLNGNGNNLDGGTGNGIISVEGSSVQLIYVDATRGWVLTDASKASDIAEDVKFVTATGGTVSCCGDYKIHTFTGPGTFTVTCAGNAAGSNSVDYLVVAGGGGGGSGSGPSGAGAAGGGAGGYRESSGTASGCYTASPLGACVSALPVSVTGYPITVGGGGSGGPATSGSGINGCSGSNSIFSTITSAGGGGGGGNNPSGNGLSGGSGGGGSQPSGSGGSGNTPPVSPAQGQNGGSGGPSGGGGGGGSTATGSPNKGAGGAGGTTSISASPTSYGGGGGGAATSGGGPGGAGGLGGGGAGADNYGQNGTSGTTNTGGAGGGSGGGANLGPSGNAGNGGSGIVIIRYKYQ